MQTSKILKEDCASTVLNMEAPSSSTLPAKKRRCHLLSPCLANHSTCVLSVLLVLTLVIALSALLISAAALVVSCHDNKEFTPQDDQKLDESTLIQVEAMLEGMGEMTFRYSQHESVHAGLERMDPPSNQKERRNVDDTDEGERITYNITARLTDRVKTLIQTGATPLAHIVGPSNALLLLPNPGSSPFVVLTKDWECKSKSGNQGVVRGGMAFHGASGFLELPVSGVYFVYQQVVFRSQDRHSDRLARSRLVACIPDEDCSYFGNAQTYMQTEANLKGTYGTSKSQGALFHFPAGAQIAVLAYNERFVNPGKSAMAYDSSGHQSYLGAFLVDQDADV